MGCRCSRRADDLDRIIQPDKRSIKKAKNSWQQAGVENVGLVVRALSGEEYLKKRITYNVSVDSLIREIAEARDDYHDTLQLLYNSEVLDRAACLGEKMVPASNDEVIELTVVKIPGPPFVVQAASNRKISIEDIPQRGAACHHDRNYTFTSLGDFANRRRMKYIKTPNDDKATSHKDVMWQIDVRVPATVYLNFRSRYHVECTQRSQWLDKDGWQLIDMRSTVSTGVPNGPYSGPVYSKTVVRSVVRLMGSNCQEGTYFAFVELEGEDEEEVDSVHNSSISNQREEAEGKDLEPEGADDAPHDTPIDINSDASQAIPAERDGQDQEPEKFPRGLHTL